MVATRVQNLRCSLILNGPVWSTCVLISRTPGSVLLAPVSGALYEGAVLRRVQVARLRELAGEHVQPRIRPEVEHSVKMEFHRPCL
jgi:hypothetical protein